MVDVSSSEANISQNTKEISHILWNLMVQEGPGSPVGIATGYGLDGPGIESR
jgi:hypothetical protein